MHAAYFHGVALDPRRAVYNSALFPHLWHGVVQLREKVVLYLQSYEAITMNGCQTLLKVKGWCTGEDICTLLQFYKTYDLHFVNTWTDTTVDRDTMLEFNQTFGSEDKALVFDSDNSNKLVFMLPNVPSRLRQYLNIDAVFHPTILCLHIS